MVNRSDACPAGTSVIFFRRDWKIREKLKTIEGSREEFSGILIRFGIKNGFKGIAKTVLLKDIRNSQGRIVADHLWFNLTKGFSELELIENDVVQFTARTKKYIKGYFGRREDVYVPIEEDYKLSHPTKVKKQEIFIVNHPTAKAGGLNREV